MMPSDAHSLEERMIQEPLFYNVFQLNYLIHAEC